MGIAEAPGILQAGDLKMDLERGLLLKGGRQIHLSQRNLIFFPSS